MAKKNNTVADVVAQTQSEMQETMRRLWRQVEKTAVQFKLQIVPGGKGNDGKRQLTVKTSQGERVSTVRANLGDSGDVQKAIRTIAEDATRRQNRLRQEAALREAAAQRILSVSGAGGMMALRT